MLSMRLLTSIVQKCVCVCVCVCEGVCYGDPSLSCQSTHTHTHILSVGLLLPSLEASEGSDRAALQKITVHLVN